jgi:hypothetical protein
MSKDNLGESFGKLTQYFRPTYRGCSVERSNGGYIWNRIWYANKEDLDAAINRAGMAISNSINRIKSNQNVNSIKEESNPE